MDDGLELTLGFHAANNLIGALLLDWTVFQTHSILKDVEPQAGIDVIPVLVIYPILLYIFSKKLLERMERKSRIDLIKINKQHIKTNGKNNLSECS
jgi:hypothetical protein